MDGTAPADLTVTGLAKALPYSWAALSCFTLRATMMGRGRFSSGRWRSARRCSAPSIQIRPKASTTSLAGFTLRAIMKGRGRFSSGRWRTAIGMLQDFTACEKLIEKSPPAFFCLDGVGRILAGACSRHPGQERKAARRRKVEAAAPARDRVEAIAKAYLNSYQSVRQGSFAKCENDGLCRPVVAEKLLYRKLQNDGASGKNGSQPRKHEKQSLFGSGPDTNVESNIDRIRKGGTTDRKASRTRTRRRSWSTPVSPSATWTLPN
jgi:hypothetical protein